MHRLPPLERKTHCRLKSSPVSHCEYIIGRWIKIKLTKQKRKFATRSFIFRTKLQALNTPRILKSTLSRTSSPHSSPTIHFTNSGAWWSATIEVRYTSTPNNDFQLHGPCRNNELADNKMRMNIHQERVMTSSI